MRKPVGVKNSATFIVDTTKLKHKNDLKSDDMGGWIHKGKPVRFYELKRCPSSGEVYGANPSSKGAGNAYQLTRIYYHHRGTTEFRKTIFYVYSKSIVNLTLFVTAVINHWTVPLEGNGGREYWNASF